MPTKPTALKISRLNEDKNKSWSKTGFDYSNTRWRKLQKIVKFEEPLCRECLKEDKLTPTYIIDHIIPIPKCDPYDRDNLQGLCMSCHQKKTKRENQKP